MDKILIQFVFHVLIPAVRLLSSLDSNSWLQGVQLAVVFRKKYLHVHDPVQVLISAVEFLSSVAIHD